jgi:hypothetical protein
MVQKMFDPAQLGRGDGLEVGPFGEELSNQPIGALLGTMLVRTTLVRTTGFGEV